MKRPSKSGRQRSVDQAQQTSPRTVEPASQRSGVELPGARRSTIAKVSHTLSLPLARRLEEFAFFQRLSESAVIEFALNAFFTRGGEDAELGDLLRSEGAGRRRKT